MFCYQCEQTVKGTGCTVAGVCGKDAETAALQDLVRYAATGVSQYAYRSAKLGARDRAVDVAVIEALFTTVTNVNFDPARLDLMIRTLMGVRDRAQVLYTATAKAAGQTPAVLTGPAVWKPAADRAALLQQAEALSIAKRKAELGDTLAGLQELVVYGLKGAAAYMDHAQILGQDDPAVYAALHEALASLVEQKPDVGALTGLALKVGEVNLRVMQLLDQGNTGTYGDPEPTAIRITPVKGKAILVSGHDLKDLFELLQQTEGSGINIYTHGEMLPANAYPALKKFKHLAGNYGGAWQNQHAEFEAFPGAILMTTNCIQKPRDSYRARIFTSGMVAFPGVTHIADGKFKPVIDAARAMPGFAATETPEKTIMGGFGHAAVMSVAGPVIDAVKAGAIKHFFLVGGCDGAKAGRNYYTDFAQAVPKDCVILTLACGKFRFNKLDFGDIGGIPRLLDIGQCNDAYSAVEIALALAKAFNCGVNDLPLSMVLSWYEQKAVVILLSLLHLGIRNIRLGPSLPAFVSPDVLNVLVSTFNLAPTTTVEADLKAMLKQ